MTRRDSRLAWMISGVASIASIAFRLIPYGVRPPNLAPVGAVGVYGGAKQPFWAAVATQLGIMAVSDLLLRALSGYEGFNPFVYVSLVAYAAISRMLLRRSWSVQRVGLASILGSLQFFLFTNFGAWIHEIMQPNGRYTADLAGLTTCFIKALPYLTFTVVGDLGFSLVLLGVHEWLAATVKADVPAQVEETAS